MKSSTGGAVSLSTLLLTTGLALTLALALTAQASAAAAAAATSGSAVANRRGSADTKDALVPLESGISNAKIQLSAKDMATAASKHGKSHGKYYMYAEVPKKGAYKMGFKRGNHKHMIERKESVHKSHVHSYFKWHDKKGKGSHKFEFKHKGKKHHG